MRRLLDTLYVARPRLQIKYELKRGKLCQKYGCVGDMVLNQEIGALKVMTAAILYVLLKEDRIFGNVFTALMRFISLVGDDEKFKATLKKYLSEQVAVKQPHACFLLKFLKVPLELTEMTSMTADEVIEVIKSSKDMNKDVSNWMISALYVKKARECDLSSLESAISVSEDNLSALFKKGVWYYKSVGYEEEVNVLVKQRFFQATLALNSYVKTAPNGTCYKEEAFVLLGLTSMFQNEGAKALIFTKQYLCLAQDLRNLESKDGVGDRDDTSMLLSMAEQYLSSDQSLPTDPDVSQMSSMLRWKFPDVDLMQCVQCDTPPEDGKLHMRCPCGRAYYYSTRCQKKDRKVHRSVCFKKAE